jgi:lipoprotein Spr
MQCIKSLFFSLFLLIILSITIISCEYQISNKNQIASKNSILDTGSRFIITKKDTATVIPVIDSAIIDKVIKVAKTNIIIKPISTPTVVKPIIKLNARQMQLVNYAKSLIGKPYATGQNTPEKGFDNSGFVNHVFSKFNIEVPRYSAAYVVAGNSVKEGEAAAGDILLFSKSDSVKKVINQVAIIISNQGQPTSFILCSSGKSNGVVIANLNSYYKPRLMGIRRLLE